MTASLLHALIFLAWHHKQMAKIARVKACDLRLGIRLLVAARLSGGGWSRAARRRYWIGETLGWTWSGGAAARRVAAASRQKKAECDQSSNSKSVTDHGYCPFKFSLARN